MVIPFDRKRNAAAIALTGATLVGAMLWASPAMADPPPGCSAADRMQMMADVSSATADYVRTHPDVNTFFSGLAGQPHDAMRTQIHDYMNADPTVASDLRGIRQPMKDMRDRCGAFFKKT
ncbi:MAG: heme-binding protein [Candidatus Sericytochromatia bacterium]